MILEKGECVLCRNRTEAGEICEILYENGYRMFAAQFDIRTVGDDGCNWHGLRWPVNEEFPNCIVATSEDQKDNILMDIIVQGTKYHYEYFEDFIVKTKKQIIEVGDLL